MTRDTYEYAGFMFNLVRDEAGKVVNMEAAPGQHEAAYKDKHRRAALECWVEDNRE